MSGPSRAGREWKSFYATFPQDLSAVGSGSKERRRESPPESAKRRRWISSNAEGHENCTDTQARAQSKLKSGLASSSVNIQGRTSSDSPWKRLENLQRPRDTGQVEVSADEECAGKSKLRKEGQQIGTRALPQGISAIPAKRLIDATKPMIKSRRQEAACTCRRPAMGDKVPEAQWQCSKCFSLSQKACEELSRPLSLPAHLPKNKSQAPDLLKAQLVKHEVLQHGAWLGIASMMDDPAGIRVVYECDGSEEVILATEIATRLRTRSDETDDDVSRFKMKVDNTEFDGELQIHQLSPENSLDDSYANFQAVEFQKKNGSEIRAKEICFASIGGDANAEVGNISDEGSKVLSQANKQARAPKRSNSSDFKGVTWKSNKWIAQLCTGGKVVCLGQFSDEIEAALKYDEVAALHGKPLNFPWETTAPMHNPKGRSATEVPEKSPRQNGGNERVLLAGDGNSRLTSSKYIGVSWNKRDKNWISSIRLQGVLNHLGFFTDEKEAAVRYDKAAADLGRPLNFPPEIDPLHRSPVGQNTARAHDSILQDGCQEAALSCYEENSLPAASRYTGVHWCAKDKKWISSINNKDGLIHLGSFHDEKEAALQYDEAAQKVHRPVNFPQKTLDRLSKPNAAEVFEISRDNAQPLSSDNAVISVKASRYMGVCWKKRDKKWVSTITIDGKRTYLGCFDDEEAAALKYDETAATINKPLNFPSKVTFSSSVGAVSSALPHSGNVARKNGKHGVDLVHASLEDGDGSLSSTSSKYTGVCWIQRINKWRSKIKFKGKTIHLGTFNDEREAAMSYDEAAAELGRPLNFLRENMPTEDSLKLVKSRLPYDSAEQEEPPPENLNLVSSASSKYTGVYWHKNRGRWISSIEIEGKSCYLGCFTDEKEAAHRYDKAAAEMGKPVNFPQEAASLDVLTDLNVSRLPKKLAKEVDIEDETLTKHDNMPPSSIYSGVTWNLQRNKWRSKIFAKGKSMHLGYFADEIEAARKYDESAAIYGKPMNFPRDAAPLVHHDTDCTLNSSRYTGVHWNNKSEKWVSRISNNGKKIHLGSLDDEIDAALDYDEAAASHGKNINFPLENAHLSDVGVNKMANDAPESTTKEFDGKQESWVENENSTSSTLSKDTGVYLGTRAGKWISNIKIDRKTVHLGSFDDEIEAALKVDEAAAVHGRSLNFPAETIPLGENDKEAKRTTSVEEDLRLPMSSQSSKYTGVSWNKRKNKWASSIKVQGKTIHLGYFDNEEEAARCRDIAAGAIGRPLNFSDTISEKPVSQEKVEITSEKTKLLAPTRAGQRIDASLIHCSDGPSLAIAALRSWIQPQILQQEQSPQAPLALIAGVKLLVSRMSEEPAGGWVALAGRSAPPRETDVWRSSLCEEGLGQALADICRHWPNDSQLLETCLDAFGKLFGATHEVNAPEQASVCSYDGMNEIFDLALKQFGDCTKKGWLPVLRKLFEFLSLVSCSRTQDADKETVSRMLSRAIPALVLALQQTAASVSSLSDSLSECKALVRWCGRLVWNVVVCRGEESGNAQSASETLFVAGILDAALAICRAFSDSESVQYWSLKMVVSILHTYKLARVRAAELGFGRVASAALNRSTGNTATSTRRSGAKAEIFVVASQCLKYIPLLESDTLTFKAALHDAQIKQTDTWSAISTKCTLDSRWHALHTLAQKKAAINEYQLKLWEAQRKETEAKDAFLEMLGEHRHELNHMTSWSAVRYKLSSDARFKALTSRIERVEMFEAFVASLRKQPQVLSSLSKLSSDSRIGLGKDARIEGHRNEDVTKSSGTASRTPRQMSPQFKKVVTVFCGPRSSSIARGQYFQDYFRGIQSEEVTNIFLRSFWRCFRVGALSGRWNPEMTEFNLLLYSEEDLNSVMKLYHGGSSMRLLWKSQITSTPLHLEPYVWTCLCSELNFSDTEQCSSCLLPKLRHEPSELPLSNRPKSLPKTWSCPNCAKVNDLHRDKCSQCFCGRGVFRDESGHRRQFCSVDSRKRAHNSEDSTTVQYIATKRQKVTQNYSSTDRGQTLTLKSAIKLHFNMETLIGKLATPVQGRIHQLFFSGELLPSSLRYTILRKLQLLKMENALVIFDRFAQEAKRSNIPPHNLLFKLLDEQFLHKKDGDPSLPEASIKSNDDPSTTPPGTPPLSPSLAHVYIPPSRPSHAPEPLQPRIPDANEVHSIENQDDKNFSDDEDDQLRASKLTVDCPWERLHFDERAGMLWANIDSQRAQNKLHSKTKSPFNVLVDRDSIVQSMFLASGRGMKSHSHWEGPINNLLKPLRVTFGSYHVKQSSFGATAEKKSWSSEGGGRGDKTEDLGGATAEAFSCFWDELSSFEVATRAGWTGHLFQPEGEVLATIIDDELSAPDFVESHGSHDVGDIMRGAASADNDSSLEARQATLGHFEALGRVLLWALVQRQPIPSVLATPLFLGQLLGLDLIRGPSPHRLPEKELCEEVLRCYPSLAWLIRGLNKEMFTDDQPTSSSSSLSVSSSSTSSSLFSPTATFSAPHASLLSLSFGAFEDDEPLTPANREEKLRAALGSLLVDQRTEVMAAIRRGFTLNTTFDAVSSSLGSLFTWPERQRLVSGEEKISAAAFIAIVEPQYPEDDESGSEMIDSAGKSVNIDRGSSSSSRSSGCAVLVSSQQAEHDRGTDSSSIDCSSNQRLTSSTSTDPAILEANVAMLFRVVRSERFEGLVVGLLRFITGCPSILDRSMRIKVEFVADMSTSTVPTAHTCFQTLYLSAAAYESEEQLARLLEICANNSTSFGQK